MRLGKRFSRFNAWWNFVDWAQGKSQRLSFIRTFFPCRQAAKIFIYFTWQRDRFWKFVIFAVADFNYLNPWKLLWNVEIVREGAIISDLKKLWIFFNLIQFKQTVVKRHLLKSGHFINRLITTRCSSFQCSSKTNEEQKYSRPIDKSFSIEEEKQTSETFHPVYFHE